MKILALRVRNLASLAGEVDIDFEAAPLAHAGLFAITGPTGAGKSTLLDALCLALYDSLPRLASTEDVRSVLRHGTADASAEVDFVGQDGGRYRSRWEVRRARNRAEGRLQAQTMSLVDLTTGLVLGGGKRETLEAIRVKVGLDYGQFRRSVLLAQNDFDAFLRAKPGDRAELLELMTGTAIYGELSMAAYERCKIEETVLKALDEELARVNVMADDVRAVVVADLAGADEEVARLALEVTGIERGIAWHHLSTDLAGRLADAQAQLAAAEGRTAAAEPERQQLARVRLALSAAPLVREVDRLAVECDGLADALDLANQDLGVCAGKMVEAGDEREKARLAEETAEAAFKAAAPMLDRAADLDSRIVEGQRRVDSCAAAVTQSEAIAGQARANAERLGRERQAAGDVIAGLDAWISQNQGRRLLADQLDRWLDAVAQQATATREHRDSLDISARATGEIAALAADAKADMDTVTDLAAKVAEIDKAIQALGEQVDAIDIEALENERDGLGVLDDHLAEIEKMAGAAQALAARAAELEARRCSAEARLASATKDRAGLEANLQTVKMALPEAQAALALAEAAEGEQALVLRQSLVEGEPCPVCGSRHHSLEAVHSVFTSLLATHRGRVAALSSDRDDLVARVADLGAATRSATEAIEHAATDAAGLAGERARAAARWSEACDEAQAQADTLGFGLGDLPAVPEAGIDLDPARIDCQMARESVVEDLQSARATETERRRKTEEREHLRLDLQAVKERQAQAANRKLRLEAEEKTARADAERAFTRMQQVTALLDGPLAVLPGWESLLPRPETLAAQLRHLADEWREKLAGLERQREAERSLASKTESAGMALENAVRNAAKDRTAWKQEQATLDRLGAARALIFEGHPTGEVRTGLNSARTGCKQDHQRAQEAWAAAAQARSAADSRVRTLTEAQASTAAALSSAIVLRDSRLTAIPLGLDQVRDAMAMGDPWVAEAEACQSALREAEAAARAVLDERSRTLSDHQAGGPPDLSAEQLAELLPLRIADRDTARERAAEFRQRLGEDERNRGAADDARGRIATQRGRHDLWRGMADLIGSADGKKFRLFAQGLTLDRLLGLANHHLAELTPRYVLQRVPASDLDLQVIDHDMADEVRGVANLSGGERFLVSLSLALGLASMTGSHTLAESLFIDEGFGALDTDSLDVAIAALETLHASGRKVGVISHVQAMIDRIGVQVRVSKLGGGRSAIECRTA